MTAILPPTRDSSPTTKRQTIKLWAGRLNAALLLFCAAMTTPLPPEPRTDQSNAWGNIGSNSLSQAIGAIFAMGVFAIAMSAGGVWRDGGDIKKDLSAHRKENTEIKEEQRTMKAQLDRMDRQLGGLRTALQITGLIKNLP
jgi:hypothetical protein